jgi:outer membrane protein assembly factor BamB
MNTRRYLQNRPQQSPARMFSVASRQALCVATCAAMLLAGCAGQGMEGKRPTGVTVTGASNPSAASSTGPSTSSGTSTSDAGSAAQRTAAQPAAEAAPVVVVTDARFPALDAGWREVGYRLDWVGYPFVTNTGASQIAQFAVSGNTVVALDKRSVVALLDASTGQVRWSTQLASPLTRFMGLAIDPSDASRIVASSESEAFLLSASTGTLVGRERFGKVIGTEPVLDSNLLIAGTGSGEAIGHRLGTGLSAWAFLGVGSFASDPVRLSRTVGMVSEAGDVLFLDPSRGSLVGRARTYGPQASAPISLGDAMVVASRDQSVWCFDENGTTRWRHRTPVRLESQPGLAPLASGNVVVIDVIDEGLIALEASTGNVKWKNTTAGGNGEARLVGVRAGNLLVHSGSTLYVLSPNAGRIVRQVSTEGIERFVADKPVDGNLFAITSTNLVGKMVVR